MENKDEQLLRFIVDNTKQERQLKRLFGCFSLLLMPAVSIWAPLWYVAFAAIGSVSLYLIVYRLQERRQKGMWLSWSDEEIEQELTTWRTLLEEDEK